MDKDFLDFWGRLFLTMSEGQRQFDAFSRWMPKGFSGMEDLSEFFHKLYGLDKTGKGGAECFKLYEKASEVFQQSFREYLRLLDLIPREEHEALVRECESLRRKNAEQEETIAQLRKILSEKGMESLETVENLQNILKKQTDQFQEMVTAVGQMFQQRRPPKAK